MFHSHTRDASDRANIEELYRQYEKALYNLAYRYVWNREQAQDIVQEAFLRLWKMRRRIDWPRAKPLVFKVTVNVSRTHYKRRRRQTSKEQSLAADVMTSDSNPQSLLTGKEQMESVRQAFDKLDASAREALLLTTFSELTHKQIADIVGVAEGTIASRKHNAMKQLKQSLETNHEHVRT